ncbi:MAG TPA: hemerythrin domain-containing protein [Spirochaetota bacterium]|nr:hemerythrin domain-containing protein [Spirochaetota bacterium]
MKTADLLKREHDAILDFLEVLESVCRNMEAGNDVPAEDLTIILDFIVSFTGKYHRAREESIVFPAMENAGILHQNGMLEALTAQHHALQGYTRLMEDALTHIPFHRDKFIKAAEDYTARARLHIEKEIHELFPLADSKMDQASIEKMGRELDQFDVTVTGIARIEELYNIPGLLKGAYQ